ncbi:MAG: glycine zipper 2TM domain-containing protein, partial [Lysobacterales bacterium]
MIHARNRARSLTLLSVPLLVLALAACGGGSSPPPSVAEDPAPGPAVDAVAGAGLEPADGTAQPGEVTGTDQTTPGAATTTGSSPAAPAPTPSAPAAPPPARPAGAANTGARDARVVSVTPVTRTVDHSYEVCEDGQRSYTRPPRDENRIAGAVIGGVAGGVAGSQVGSGRGRDLATVAGA